jgi:hypothetical protein
MMIRRFRQDCLGKRASENLSNQGSIRNRRK